MKKRILLLIALMLALPSLVFASGEGAATLYNQGNALYAKGDYEGALKSYRHALEQHVADPRLEQNIGSAYLKLGDVGHAIFHFKRGLRMAPRDGDLRFDLAFAKDLREDEVPAEATYLVSSLFDSIMNMLTTGGWVLAATLFFVASMLALLIMLFVNGLPKMVLSIIAGGMAFLLLLTAPFVAARVYQEYIIDEGVIVAHQVTAHTAPQDSADEAFTVHGGMPCRIREVRGNWARVTLAIGIEGWLPASAVRSLNVQAD